MPFESVWNYFLAINNVPSDMDIINEINDYDKKVLQNR
jgi:L-rhamnose isomerase